MPASENELYDVWLDFDAPERYADPDTFENLYEVYRGSGSIQEDVTSDEDMFYQFLNAFVPEEEPQTAEYWQDIRQSYYDLAEITDGDIDWEAYREAIGYGENE